MIALYTDIKKAARSVAFEWPGIIDAEDVEQEIWAKLLESKNYVQQIEDMTVPQRNESLRRIGHQIASRYRNDYDHFTGNFRYGTNDVRKRLEAGLLVAAVEETENGSETLTEYLDMVEGFQILKEKNERYASVLLDRYVYENYSPESTSARTTMSRAVTALADKMNQAHRRRHAVYEDGPGSRRVVSNAAAQIISSQNHSGSYSTTGANTDGRKGPLS